MSEVQDIMQDYLAEISSCVETGNKNKVIALINEMKNYYMIQYGLKPGTAVLPKVNSKKLKSEKEVKVIGKFIEPNLPIEDPNKPRKHIFY